ncbi:hypothetical protein AOLI_G00200530 [Acnodon oligacanthus]
MTETHRPGVEEVEVEVDERRGGESDGRARNGEKAGKVNEGFRGKPVERKSTERDGKQKCVSAVFIALSESVSAQPPGRTAAEQKGNV